MKTAIVIGCYRLTSFIELNILRCRRIWPYSPILLSDDYSPESVAIRQLADKYDCDYTCPQSRRSHFSGDFQSFINGLIYGNETESQFVVKLSQRLIPVLPEFREAFERAMMNEICAVCLPGQLNPVQIIQPNARFYKKFGLLTDVVGFRPNAIQPEELLSVYRERAAAGRHPADSFAETTWGWLLEHKFQGPKHRLLPEWTHHAAGQPKLYLRKSQSSSSDYSRVAMMEGLKGDWDLREWIQIERKGYRPKADRV